MRAAGGTSGPGAPITCGVDGRVGPEAPGAGPGRAAPGGRCCGGGGGAGGSRGRAAGPGQPGAAAAVMKKQFNRMKQLANQTVGRWAAGTGGRLRSAVSVSPRGRAGGEASSGWRGTPGAAADRGKGSGLGLAPPGVAEPSGGPSPLPEPRGDICIGRFLLALRRLSFPFCRRKY